MNKEEFTAAAQRYREEMLRMQQQHHAVPAPAQSEQSMSVPMQPRQPMPAPMQPRQPMSAPMQPRQPMPAPMQPRQPMPAPMQPRQPMPAPMQPRQPMSAPMPAPMQPRQPMPAPMQPPMQPIEQNPPMPEEAFYPFSSFFPPNGWTGVSLPDMEVLREEGDRVALPVAAAQDALPVDSVDANGTLLISVRTAEGALPIEDALVTVTQERGGDHVLISSQRTNSSGKVRPLELPAPLTPPNQQRVPFAPYTIRVDAEGYRSEQSLDVPIFAGITSRQNFLMKPLPLGTDATSDIVTYYNNEPIF